MTKAKLLDFVKSLVDTNVRIANDPTIDSGHKALAMERFWTLLAIMPAIESLAEASPESTPSAPSVMREEPVAK